MNIYLKPLMILSPILFITHLEASNPSSPSSFDKEPFGNEGTRVTSATYAATSSTFTTTTSDTFDPVQKVNAVLVKASSSTKVSRQIKDDLIKSAPTISDALSPEQKAKAEEMAAMKEACCGFMKDSARILGKALVAVALDVLTQEASTGDGKLSQQRVASAILAAIPNKRQ
jgi:hypothetical protein